MPHNIPAICFLLRGKLRQPEVTKETESPNAGSKSSRQYRVTGHGPVNISVCQPGAGLSYQGHQLKALENLVVVIEDNQTLFLCRTRMSLQRGLREVSGSFLYAGPSSPSRLFRYKPPFS